MPATRSRTENWRQSLSSVYEKGGALEITLPRHIDAAHTDHAEGSPAADLIWRVRLIGLSDTEIIIEQPGAMGHSVPLHDGIELIALLAIGQNRWMFRTRNLGATTVTLAGGRPITGYRLMMPESVERCQRRNFYRISTVGVVLPGVEVFPLIDPASAAIADAAYRCDLLDELDHHIAACPVRKGEPVLPEVGPSFQGMLVNIGGGGVGIVFDPAEQPKLNSTTTYWLRISLPPHLPLPLTVSARVRHTHLDSSQRLYAGMSFEFAQSPGHEKFIVDQLMRYVATVQREQLKRQKDE
ncbi:MAG: hypothetical protein SFZ24_06970 [Planctomycetota bacterium]|nr:hypothetical protein [Planctomycetota bacterium]